MFERIAGKQVRLALEEEFLQAEVDCSNRAMEIDRPEQFSPDRNKPDEG